MRRFVLLALCVMGYVVGGGVTLVAMFAGYYAWMLYEGPDEWRMAPAVALIAVVLATAGGTMVCFAHWMLRRL